EERQGGARNRARRRVWAPELLEDRVLLTTYTVDRTTDTGAGTGTSGDLRYVLTQANADNGSTIQFGVSGTITLASTLPNITADMTINGPGASNLTIQGTSFSRVFFINGFFTVGISGLTLANTDAPGSGDGGAILNNNGTLTVTACTFTGNSANTGGAIYNNRFLTVSDS